MGADMIGYQVILPQKLTKEEIKKVEEHLDDLENLIKSPNFIENIMKERTAEEPLLKRINELSLCLAYELEEIEEEDYPDLFDEILSIISSSRDFIKRWSFGGRDTFERYITLLGRPFLIIFCGDSSWGDEPSGEGYTLMKELDKVGILSLIENITIPHEPLSVQFIKE